MLWLPSLSVSAEKFNYETAGIEYESVDDLENCLNKHIKGKTTRHEDQQPFLSTMKDLYIPKILEDNPDAIQGIMITPTYTMTEFTWKDQLVWLFYYYGAGENQMSIAQYVQEDGEGYQPDRYPGVQTVNGYNVYSYFAGDAAYCWMQDNDYLLLRNLSEEPEKRNSYSLCEAIKHPLNLVRKEPKKNDATEVKQVPSPDKTDGQSSKTEDNTNLVPQTATNQESSSQSESPSTSNTETLKQVSQFVQQINEIMNSMVKTLFAVT